MSRLLLDRDSDMTQEKQDLALQFFTLYEGLNRAHGTYRIAGVDEKRKEKVVGKAQTVAEPVTVETWREHLLGITGLGVVPINDDAMVRWGAVDIDIYPLDLNALGERLERLEIPAIIIRTKSGGAHVTVYANDWVPADLMRSRMTEIAVALGHPGVEIYPKQTRLASERDFGNWLNMPYFDHANTNRYAVFRGHALSAEQFLQLAAKLSVSIDELREMRVDSSSDWADAPPCLQTMAMQGVPAGQRNNAIFAFGVFARLKYDDDNWEAELDRINQTVCPEPLKSSEMSLIVKSLTKKNYFYPCKKAPLTGLCNREACLKREYGIGTDSQELNVTIGKLVKINHRDVPTWIIDVNGIRFEIETEDLLAQARFHKKCVDKTNIWPITIKPKAWHDMVTAKLQDLEIIEPPEDSSNEGRFMQYVEQFCVVIAQGKDRDDILLGKPWTNPENGKIYFRSGDLMAYLTRQHFNISQRAAWNILRGYGIEHDQFNIKGRCVRTWVLQNFKRQDAPHRVTDAAEGTPF